MDGRKLFGKARSWLDLCISITDQMVHKEGVIHMYKKTEVLESEEYWYRLDQRGRKLARLRLIHAARRSVLNS